VARPNSVVLIDWQLIGHCQLTERWPAKSSKRNLSQLALSRADCHRQFCDFKIERDVVRSGVPAFALLPIGAFETSVLLPQTQLPVYAMAATRPRPTNATYPRLRKILVERLRAEFLQFREPIVCVRSGKRGTAGVVVAITTVTPSLVITRSIGWRNKIELGQPARLARKCENAVR
jgi:hypothetical protein